MPALDYGYDYVKPENTATIDDFISCKSDTDMNHYNMSFINTSSGIQYSVYNVVSDYLDELRENYCLKVELTSKQLGKYKYRPKLLCYDIYGNGELAFIILLINDMWSVKQFTKRTILLPTVKAMDDICDRIFNTNKEDIDTYNQAQ